MILPEDIELCELIVRNAKSKFHFHHEDTGYVFYREDNRKGIRLTDDQLTRIINGEHCHIDFGSSGRGIFYADWSERDHRIKQEESRRQRDLNLQCKKEFDNTIEQLIDDNDPDLLAYIETLNKVHPHPHITVWHKKFIYGVRNQNYDVLTEVLAHGRGWNDVSKRFFAQLTGAKLPNTKHGIQEFLESWCSVAKEV